MKNKSGKLQMTIQNEISSKEVKIGSNLISQTTVKKTLDYSFIHPPPRWWRTNHDFDVSALSLEDSYNQG